MTIVMNKSLRSVIAVFVMCILSAVSCMEPAELVPYTTDRHPYVQCIIYPDSTVQYLRLGYVSRESGSLEPIPEAGVRLYRYSGESSDELVSVGSFYHIGDELWGFRFGDSPRPYDKYLLEVVLPSRDTLVATTTIPYEFETSDAEVSPRFHHLIGGHRPQRVSLTFDESRLPKMCTGFEIRYVVDPDIVDGEKVKLFTIWAWKEDWNEATLSYEVAEMLATDAEDAVDGFNLCGGFFTSAGQRGIVESFPQVAGRPLHYKYLRMPVGFSPINRVIWIAGDFRGPHYRNPLMGPISDNIDPGLDLPWLERGPKGYVVFVFASPELDSFMKDAVREQMLSETGDPLLVYRNTNHYTNVRNVTTQCQCAGVFGAAYVQHVWWSYIQEEP